jgi:hypothetical protein
MNLFFYEAKDELYEASNTSHWQLQSDLDLDRLQLQWYIFINKEFQAEFWACSPVAWTNSLTSHISLMVHLSNVSS